MGVHDMNSEGDTKVQVEQKLRELGLQLPDPPKAIAEYLLFRRAGNLVFTSGTGPVHHREFAYQGKVGRDLSLEEGREAARLTMLNLLSILKFALGDLDSVSHIVKVTGFVASSPGFGAQPEVMNAASELLERVFGEKGRHARSAIGVSELPRNIPVEIEMVVECSDGMPGEADSVAPNSE